MTGLTFRAQAASYDPKDRTFEAVASTFADVNRRTATGTVVERLDPNGMDTTHLVGAPLLNGHRSGSATDVIGHVTAFRMEDGKLVVSCRLVDSPDVDPIAARLEGRAIRDVSIGFRIDQSVRSTDPKTRSTIVTATKWAPFEVSLVPIGADAGAKIRSENPMPDNIIEQQPQGDDIVQTRAAIRQIARTAGLSAEWADAQIDSGADIVAARAAAFEGMTARQTPAIRVTRAEPTDAMQRTRGVEDALFFRMAGGAPSEAARPYVGLTLADMARDALEAAGVSTRGMGSPELVRRAMTISDLPALLESSTRRVLMAGYDLARSPIATTLTRQTTRPDFRETDTVKRGDMSPLDKVSESGELKAKTVAEATETYTLGTYGNTFALSHRAVLNDDLSALTDWSQIASRAAATTEANLIVAALLSNGKMNEDGKPLFDKSRNAAGTGAALSVATLGSGRQTMRSFKALDGVTLINSAPKYLLVGPAMETIAEQFLAGIYATTPDDVNPWGGTGKLSLLVEPRITDSRWYLFADPAAVPVLEAATIASEPGPQISTRLGWNTLGTEFRVYLHLGAGAVDWRGAYMNPGASA
ncbi:peptidase [Novacetimonas maltaceti]|uniref:Prohead serine protease domain-containing protein n=1 Tax=Novacetimonas maltaceti TaxID=1203393 RepID=A0A2S3W408_9PROT|nr:prohead protease/major capsid protein fusion protein [Novacetimonas maltaceti]POF63557.1 hypothetical protein KMAL_07370 [Novacetimonas maltaceti]PYD59830.1 peptidase [Novacetimonas maltaceti]